MNLLTYLRSHDLDLDSMTLTLDNDLSVLKMYLHTKNEVCRSRRKARTEHTDALLCSCDRSVGLKVLKQNVPDRLWENGSVQYLLMRFESCWITTETSHMEKR